jgi:type IV pilus assembly protein PilY1
MGDLPDFRPTLAGNQTVKISTIGIGANDPEDIALVNDLVTEGGKPYFVASKADLELAYYDSTGGGATTTPTWATGQINFAGVGKAVSFENQMVHDAGLYFPVFEARVGPAWPGNLKRYELKGDPDDATVPVIVRGVSGKPAIDETIGRFTEDVRSHWSSAVDGNAAGEGGAASKLDPPNRKLYSNLDSGSALHASNNRITKANLSPSDFGIGLTDAQKDKLVDWMSGNGDTAQYMGHPLMSVPTVVSYGALGSATPNQVAFVGTNQGYLHAIDANASDGNELWAFMPKKLLPNIFKQSVGSPADQTPYGMDGSPMVWSKNGGDRKIIGDAGDTILLVTCMRRGGDS